MKKLTPADQRMLESWNWLYTEGYRRGYAEAMAGRPDESTTQSNDLPSPPDIVDI